MRSDAESVQIASDEKTVFDMKKVLSKLETELEIVRKIVLRKLSQISKGSESCEKRDSHGAYILSKYPRLYCQSFKPGLLHVKCQILLAHHEFKVVKT